MHGGAATGGKKKIAEGARIRPLSEEGAVALRAPRWDRKEVAPPLAAITKLLEQVFAAQPIPGGRMSSREAAKRSQEAGEPAWQPVGCGSR